MKNIEILKDLEDKGFLKQLVFEGLVSPKVQTYMHMYYHVDAQLKKRTKKNIAVCNTAAFFNVTPRSVYNAFKSLK